MLVYGDHEERADTREGLDALKLELQLIAGLEPGLQRHSRLVSALIEAGRVQQGVADALFDNLDAGSDTEREIGSFVHRLAQCVVTSWDSGGRETGILPAVPDVTGAAQNIELRLPEGFAFYALYPEAYADAAPMIKLQAPPRVIGLRSIGTSLAAVAAAALGAEPAVTLRPFGDPWYRRVAVSEALQARLLDARAHFVIVDEGPGLSGSSFGAVIDWLRERSVPLERIAVMPSHDGAPGPNANKARREQWDQVQRLPADLGPRLGGVLTEWLRDLLGPLDGALVDISGGHWRPWAFRGEDDQPAADAAIERRKFLAFASGETWLVKFVGLGCEGERKIEIARRLSGAGLVPEPLALVHGFLVERWHGRAVRLTADERPLAEIERYIGLRRRLVAGMAAGGASMRKLYEMAVQNFEEAGFSAPILHWSDRVDELESKVRRIPTDNRMLPHEWLRLPTGELLKSDAIDHHRSHDLIGCQDVAWDVAGAIVEFSLDVDEAEQLRSPVERTGAVIDRELLNFYLLAYRAFRIGQLQFAIDGAQNNPAELERAQRALAALKRPLATHSSFVGSP